MKLLIAYAAGTILISFLCSILEAVLLSINKTFIKLKAKEDSSFAEKLQYLKDNIDEPLIQTSQDPRIQAEWKAGQSTYKGIIFVSESNFESEAGSEWMIGTCVKSPCVAAGNNELVSAYR